MNLKDNMGKTCIKINGNEFEFEKSLTVSQLLEERNITGSMFVVEKNLVIVAKEEYSSTAVLDGDVFEVVGFFGGG